MDALIDRVSTSTGLEPETARKAIGNVLNFIQTRLPTDQAAAVLDRVPGARQAAVGAAADEGGGILDGLMTAPATGISGLATQLTSLGLGTGEMQALVHEVLAFLRGHAGEEAIAHILAAEPALGQFT